MKSHCFFAYAGGYLNKFPYHCGIIIWSMDPSSFLYLGIFVCLILIALFAGYETAFISANRLNIELKKKQGRKSAIRVGKFLEKPVQLLGTVLLVSHFLTTAFALMLDELVQIGVWRPFGIFNDILRVTSTTCCSALILVLLCQFLPKAVFKAKADVLVFPLSAFIGMVHELISPITNLFVGSAKWILKYVFNIRTNDGPESFGKLDIDFLFRHKPEERDRPQHLHTELFENALSLPKLKVRQCLVPRTEIEGIDLDTSIEAVYEKFHTTHLSKLIVYKGKIDEILGYVHQLDFFKKPASVAEVLLPIPVVPETMSAIDLMSKFTKERKSIAWVVDEFGGTAGIITMEDILEEIFGEIQDEYDKEEFVEKQIAEDEYIFSGRLELDYIAGKYGLSFQGSESETLSGHIIDHHDTIPSKDDVIVIGNHQFFILTVSETTIGMVKLKVFGTSSGLLS